MKKLYAVLAILAFVSLSVITNAQERYLDEFFTGVTVTPNQIYGYNETVLDFANSGALTQPLILDVYEPTGDAVTERPLVIYMHSGNFLPKAANMSPVGTRNDSCIVEICTRLAKMGYVVANIEYRQGWNPIAATQGERVNTLINAAYRGIQDLRTAVRYFKMNVDVNGNPFRVDTSKIVAWGQGTGGYLSLTGSVLDDYNEILIAKFIGVNGAGNPQPMVIEQINGDIYGTSWGILPDGMGGAVDTFCRPNHVGYNSDFHLSVNMGGAMADTSMFDGGEVPMISFHSPTDPFAPYVSGTVIVPGLNLPVVDVQGSFLAQELAQSLGNQSGFVTAGLMDAYTTSAAGKNDGQAGATPVGLFPWIRPATQPADIAGYEWWDASDPFHANGLATNPDMSKAKAMAFIDTLIGFYAPRACIALNLGCGSISSVDLLDKTDVGFTAAPNPATNEITFKTNQDEIIRAVYVYNLAGQVVQYNGKVDNNRFVLNRQGLAAGTYIAKLRLDDGVFSDKIVFE